MPHLLNVWPSICQRLRDAVQVLLMLDYDGTLTPIVDRPQLALMPSETKESLIRLGSTGKYVIAVISARALEDVSAKVGIEGLIYAGNHGLEMRGPGLDFVHLEAEQLKEAVDQAYQRLQRGLAHLAGAFTEHKGLSLTVHYRMTPDGDIRQVKEAVKAATAPLVESGSLIVSPGKKALEVRPRVDWHKGRAISRLQATYPDAALALFFGDDLGDEDGFAEVQSAGGIGVYVGSAREPTRAEYRVDSPREVGEILRLMTEL